MLAFSKFAAVRGNVKLLNQALRVINETNGRGVYNVSFSKQKTCALLHKRFTSSVLKTSLADHTDLYLSEIKQCMNHWPDVIGDLTADDTFIPIPEIRERYTKLLDYNFKITRYQSPLTVVLFYKMTEDPENVTVENLKRIYMASWCMGLIHGSLQIIDDIQDSTDNRSKTTTWHENKDIGHSISYDSYLLHHGALFILKKYFSSHKNYTAMIELFLHMIAITSAGQIMDGSYPVEQITLDRQNLVWRYKTEYVMYLFPVHLVMLLTNKFDASQLQRMKPVLLNIARYIQLKNDFTDVFRYVENDMAGGTDIALGKCTSIAVIALERANSSQRKIMEQHYGKSEKESVEAINTLFNDMNLMEIFKEMREKTFQEIQCEIDKFPQHYPRTAMHTVLDLAYNDSIN